MAWQRNTAGLKAAAQRRAQATQQRAEQALKTLIKKGEPINFKTVAKAGSVSVAWLYRQPDIRAQIEHYRANRTASRPPKRTNGKDAVIAHLKQRLNALEQEKRALEQAVEQLYGENRELQTQLRRLA
jgi:exonuclease VII small subunit